MRLFSDERVGAGLTTGRISAFSDGVFSIAITLLVLNLHIPLDIHGQFVSPKALPDALRTEWPNLLSYMLSFVIIGIYWVAHHNMFHYIKRANRPFLWINILFLMCVAFIPFPAALLGAYPTTQTAVVVYAATLIVTNLILSLLWWYATSGHRLVDEDIDPHFVSTVNRRNMTAPVVYLVAIGLSLLNIYASLVLFFVFPFYYIVPSHVDIHLTPSSRHAGEVPGESHSHAHPHAKQETSTSETREEVGS
jgi:uncharacterized membrane protein